MSSYLSLEFCTDSQIKGMAWPHRLLVFYSSGIKAEGGPSPSHNPRPRSLSLKRYVRTKCETKRKRKEWGNKERPTRRVPELFSRATWVETRKMTQSVTRLSAMCVCVSALCTRVAQRKRKKTRIHCHTDWPPTDRSANRFTWDRYVMLPPLCK